MGLRDVLRLGWDRLGAVVSLLLGVLVLVLGWVGVSGALYTGQQIPYVLSGGLGGIFLLSLAGILWLSADLRDEWSQLDRIEQLLASQEQDRPEPVLLDAHDASPRQRQKRPTAVRKGRADGLSAASSARR